MHRPALLIFTVVIVVFALPLRSAESRQSAATKAPASPNFGSQIAATIEPTRRVVYKKVGDRELRLDVFAARDASPGDKRGAFVIIHGGGWTSGNPRSMYPFAEWAANLGLVGISVEY